MKLAIIGDFNPDSKSHSATNLALNHSASRLNIHLEFEWISTGHIRKEFNYIVRYYDFFLIAPGLHHDVNAILEIIKYARLHHKPILGTCSGFQHMVIEFARNFLGIEDAAHEEYDPDASNRVISALNCNLKGNPLEIEIIGKLSKTRQFYETSSITEHYYCSFGLNPMFQKEINDRGFKIVGTDKTKGARILELKGHPFFIATLFVPQINSTTEYPNKIITAFLRAGADIQLTNLGESTNKVVQAS